MENREISASLRQDLTEENVAIYGILMNILKRWQPETKEKKVDLEEAETVTLSLKKDLRKENHSVMKELGETVIISRKDLNKESLPEKKELNETVILSPEGLHKDPLPGKVEKPKDADDNDNLERSEVDVKEPKVPDFLTETVILKPGKVQDEERDASST
jgi:hypothetical protein